MTEKQQPLPSTETYHKKTFPQSQRFVDSRTLFFVLILVIPFTLMWNIKIREYKIVIRRGNST